MDERRKGGAEAGRSRLAESSVWRARTKAWTLARASWRAGGRGRERRGGRSSLCGRGRALGPGRHRSGCVERTSAQGRRCASVARSRAVAQTWRWCCEAVADLRLAKVEVGVGARGGKELRRSDARGRGRRGVGGEEDGGQVRDGDIAKGWQWPSVLRASWQRWRSKMRRTSNGVRGGRAAVVAGASELPWDSAQRKGAGGRM